MNAETQEIIDAVDEINLALYNQLGPDSTALVTYTYTTHAQWVEWNGLQIWSSEDDMREYIEEEDKYEAIEPFLCKQITKIVNELATIKV